MLGRLRTNAWKEARDKRQLQAESFSEEEDGEEVFQNFSSESGLTMSQIRKAHSGEIIDKRLRDCEIADAVDAMELIGLHDELSRVERKWREKYETPRADGPRTRPLADAVAMNARFERLSRLVAAALRRPGEETAERTLLRKVETQMSERKPLPASK